MNGVRSPYRVPGTDFISTFEFNPHDTGSEGDCPRVVMGEARGAVLCVHSLTEDALSTCCAPGTEPEPR